MATPQEKLAEALEALKDRQGKGQIAIKSSDLSRDHRERLLKTGFIKSVMKGWYIPSRPEEIGVGETTAWYASCWAFCAAYLKEPFGDEWSLSPEQSVLIHAGSRVVPNQLKIRAPGARNNITNLVHGTRILEIRAQIAEGKQPSPYVNRIHTNWQTMRADIIAAFPEPPGIPTNKPAYLKKVDKIYANDAYHSLSIEGYRVTPDLIERVRSGDWNPDQLEADRQRRDAMAARGYY